MIIQRLVLFIGLVLAMVGCTAKPIERIVTVEVKVPVKVPCIDTVPVRPAYKFGKGDYPGEAKAAVALAEDREAAINYGDEWAAAAIGCERKF